MSDTDLPLLEEKSECKDNEDECSVSGSLYSEGHLADEEEFTGFSNSLNLEDDPTRFYTFGVPEDTDSPVGSPKKESIVGQIRELFERRIESDNEDVEAKLGLMTNTRAKSKEKSKVKMDLSMHKKQVEFLDKDVQNSADDFKALAETDPTPPKEGLSKLFIKNTAMIDRIKNKNKMFYALSAKCVSEPELKG